MAKHLVALLAALGTSWEEWVPSATWEELAQAGYDRSDVIKVGIDPELVRHGPARPDFVVVQHRRRLTDCDLLPRRYPGLFPTSRVTVQHTEVTA